MSSDSTLAKVARHLRAPHKIPRLIWKNIHSPQAAEARFDKALGLDTGGWIDPAELGLEHEKAAVSTGYEGSPVRTAEHLIGKILNRARGFTFIDFGAGKGRVMLLAAKYPFARVIGVEYSAPLYKIARANIERFRREHPGLAPMEILHLDATEYDIPETPCVMYFYNPFDAATARKVVERIKDSIRRRPRKILMIWYNCRFPELFEAPVFRSEEVNDLPRDPMRRKTDLNAMIFETVP